MSTSPPSPAQFIHWVKLSKAIDPPRLAKWLTVLKESGPLPNDSTLIAKDLVEQGLLTRFQANHLINGRHKLVIGKYRVLEPLGSGGMSKVFLCEHVTMGHRVAMKLLPADKLRGTSFVERFQREARAVASLNHPNLIRAHDLDKEGDRFYYIILDYVDGVNLDDLIRRRGPLDPVRAAHYIAQAAEGLQHVHDAALVHRDIKPGNLLLARDGSIKIIDLGLARFLSENKDNITQQYDENSVLGTIDFLSPEQGMDISKVDTRTDIYSLGATFYYMLCGQAPFEGDTVTQKLLAVQLRKPISLLTRDPNLPEDLVAIVEKMMEKQPGDRYQTAIEVAEALAPWTEEPAEFPPDEDFVDPSRSDSPSKVGPASTGRIRSKSASTPRLAPLSGSTPNRTGKVPRSTIRASKIIRKPTRRSKWPWIAGVALLALLVGGAILAFINPFKKDIAGGPKGGDTGKSAQTQALTQIINWAELPAIPAGAVVVATAGPEPRFATISEAIAAAKPDQRLTILIRDPSYHEQLTLNGTKLSNISIESGLPASIPVVWSPSSGSPDRPLLELNSIEGVRIKGIHFDGQGQVSDLIRMTGRCPDAQFEDLFATGFNKTAIVFQGTSGSEGKPITIRRLRATGAAELASAIAFESGAGQQNIRVLDSRFEGPLGMGVLIASSVSNLEVRRNRFYKMRHGIHYQPTGPATPLLAQIRGNTFSDLASGIEFAVSPPGSENSSLLVIDNLFNECGRLAELTGAPLAPRNLNSAWIWYPEFDDAKTSIPAQSRYFRKTFELSAKPASPIILNIGVDESFKVAVNGKEVGQSVSKYFDQRIYAFDIAPQLVAGQNVIAVEAANELDPFNRAFGTAAGLMAVLVDTSSGSKVLLKSDESWKVAKEKEGGWDTPEFTESSNWVKAKIWNPANIRNMPWRETVWDSSVEPYLRSSNRPIALTVAGNVRDYNSCEGYPMLESKRTTLIINKQSILGLDRADDERFLRYALSSQLNAGGSQGGPVGVPPAGQ